MTRDNCSSHTYSDIAYAVRPLLSANQYKPIEEFNFYEYQSTYCENSAND